jgi:arginine/lysine/ornithine decarboxylase
MVSPKTTDEDFSAIEKALSSLGKKNTIHKKPPLVSKKQSVMKFNQAILSPSENVDVENSLGRIASGISVSCPPAIPIVVCGELIDENAIENFKYYGIKQCNVIK